MKLDFEHFASTTGLNQPYCDVLQTRSNYHCKWLLLKAKSTAGILRRKRGFYVLQAVCVSKTTQRDMIIRGEAIPLSPVYDDLINCIETWGNRLKSGWAQDVYHYIHENLNDTDKQSIYSECIYKLVRRVVSSAFTGPTRVSLIEEWIDYFDVNYDMWSNDFYRLAVATVQFLDDRILEMQYAWNYADQIASTQSPQQETELISAAHIVPSSPVKRENDGE